MTTILGLIGAYIASVLLAFLAGKRAGRSAGKISGLKKEVELREEFEKIDNRPDNHNSTDLIDKLR